MEWVVEVLKELVMQALNSRETVAYLHSPLVLSVQRLALSVLLLQHLAVSLCLVEILLVLWLVLGY